MAFLHPDDKRTLLKRPSDGDIGGDLRNREKHLERSDEMQMFRDLYPDYDPTTAQKLNETQCAIDEWLDTTEKLRQTEDQWEAQRILKELCDSITRSGYNISKIERERKEFDRNKRINQMADSSQSQSTMVKQDRLFNFDVLLKKIKQLRNTVEEVATQLLQGDFNIEDITTKLEEVRSVIPNATLSQGVSPCFDSRVMDVLAHRHNRISPNEDTIDLKLYRENFMCVPLPTMAANKEPENDKDRDAVVMWKLVAKSLSTMQPFELNPGSDSRADILDLAVDYMSKVQPHHGSERSLPGNNFITIQNEQKQVEVRVPPFLQMKRLLSGIPNAQAVAFFILFHLPKEHHALLSCTTIFAGEHDSLWRNHVLFEEWSKEESNAFACEFSRLTPGPWTLNLVLQKQNRLYEVLHPIIISIFSLCFKPVDPTIIEPDEEDDKSLTVDPFKMVDMFAKMKLERERAAEKAIREGRRVTKEILISERCTSCGMRIFHMGRCDDCTICTTCGQERSWDGNCQACAKLRLEEWRINVDQSPISDSAVDVAAHQQNQINPNDELEKQPLRPDAINSKPEREKAEVDEMECAAISLLTMPATAEPENERAVATWKSVAISLLTMQRCQLILDNDSESDIRKLAARYMLEIQPSHESEGTLPGIDYIINQNENRGRNGIKVVPLQQIERLLYGIPDAQILAFFILSHLPEEHHALLSCTTIFAEECTPVWRNHVLFEEWSQEENVAFACEFSRLVHESSATTFVLQKWHGLLEVLNPIMISISSLCFAQT